MPKNEVTSKQLTVTKSDRDDLYVAEKDDGIRATSKKTATGFLKQKFVTSTPDDLYKNLKKLTDVGNQIADQIEKRISTYTGKLAKVFRIPDPRDPNTAEAEATAGNYLKVNPLLADTPYADGASPDNSNEAISADENLEAEAILEDMLEKAEIDPELALAPDLRAKLENKLREENRKRLERLSTPRPF